MDEQLKALLEGINALKSGQEESKERMENMQRSQEETKNELKEGMEKCHELKDSLEKKIDNVEEKINKPVLASPVPVPAASPISVKLSTYDGKTNWEVYKTQFSIISEANGWTEGVKACQLAASLRGEAAEILQTLPDTERLNWNSLYNALDLRFGQKYSKDYARLQMKTKTPENRRKLAGVCFRSRKARQLGFLRPPSNCARKNLFTVFRGRPEGGGSPEGCSLKAGVLIASSVVDLLNSVIPVTIANISDRTRTIQEGEVIVACAPVTCVDRKCNTQDLSSENLVKDLLQNTDLDEKQRCAAGGLIKEFQSLFSKTSEDFGRTRLTKYRIDTGEHPPIKQYPRRLPFAKQEEVQKLIKDMKNNDVIEPSSSPWASPIVLVRKKDGSTRFCVDYRRLNDVPKKDSYPLPRIDDTLGTLAGNTWFSNLDLKSGY
ncbi:hypothetical protein TNCV_3068341 [Trichonephila clavipes]|nr:hypothetical protein TNCV_3068341 [Trichonephila clavipes]